MSNSTRQSPESANSDVKFYFTAETAPAGDAPLKIRQQWIGVPLPSRSEPDDRARFDPSSPSYGQQHLATSIDGQRLSAVEDGVYILTTDAIAALRAFGRDQAADWWQETTPPGERLVFEANEGKMMLPEVAQKLVRALSIT